MLIFYGHAFLLEVSRSLLSSLSSSVPLAVTATLAQFTISPAYEASTLSNPTVLLSTSLAN